MFNCSKMYNDFFKKNPIWRLNFEKNIVKFLQHFFLNSANFLLTHPDFHIFSDMFFDL